MASGARVVMTAAAAVMLVVTSGAGSAHAAPAPARTPEQYVSAAASAEARRSTRRPPRRTAKPARPKVAYLTFDDGPSTTYTPQVLRTLARYDAKATFFVIGRQADARPDLVRQIRAGGHAIGNHTYDHPTLTRLPAAAIVTQIVDTDRAIGGRVTCLRPPGGATSPRVVKIAHRLHHRIALWNVDTRDWRRPGVDAITAAALRPPHGSRTPVVLLHDGGGDRTQTVAALPTILASMKRQGYRFETLPTCR